VPEPSSDALYRAILRRPRHAPARHDKLPLAVLADANNRRELVGEDRRKQREVSRAVMPRAKPIADGGLTLGETVEIAHAAGLCSIGATGQQGQEMPPTARNTRRGFISGVALATLFALPIASAQEVHFSPEERLDAIDAALIGTAKLSIDLASYALTNPVVIDALSAAQRRSVAIRIVLDPRERHDFVKLGDLSDSVRIKRGGPYMHLKAYSIDGEVLRTGSANFSTSGERAQDNDLIVIRDVSAAAKFDAHFERMWDAAQPMIEFGPAIKALEPN
jgi:phosphatidylserine/phosphatidylglycerophosphate/cardiolipin synthase-like enzyme